MEVERACLRPLDGERLWQALELANDAIGRSDPNPRVGCVIGREDGTVLGTGSTQAAGHAHAEVMALQAARAAGADVRGATVWVTLEPCAHHGRTPPCCDALAAAGIGRVVSAIEDPFPQVAGAGHARLRAERIEVCVAGGKWAASSRELNIGFFSRVERGRPWVRLKAAISLDGRTALDNGASQWITGAEARIDGHRWRQRAGAILTGAGTVLADDPRLDVREVETTLQPLRAVVDSRARTPPSARIVAAPGAAVFYVVDGADGEPLRRAGAAVVPLGGTDGRVDLHAALRDLAGRHVNEVHVEAGPTLNGALLHAGIVDELLLYVAAKILGPGRPLAALTALDALDQAWHGALVDVAMLGSDLRLRVRPTSR